MPIYEYQCQACEHEFEALQKMSEDLLKECPECQKPELKKLISASGFRLKGSGWYESDFKNSSSASKTPASSSSNTASSSTTAASSSSCCSGGACSGS
jgi:putative FmdB family regulatory protein